MRVSMAAIIQQAERKFNLGEADGVNRRHRCDSRPRLPFLPPTRCSDSRSLATFCSGSVSSLSGERCARPPTGPSSPQEQPRWSNRRDTRFGPTRPDVNRYLKWAFVEAANAICLTRGRAAPRHVSRLYERVARRKGHAKAIEGGGPALGRSDVLDVEQRRVLSRAEGVHAVSSTGDQRAGSVETPGSSTADCDIPRDDHHAVETAKIWFRRNGPRWRGRT